MSDDEASAHAQAHAVRHGPPGGACAASHRRRLRTRGRASNPKWRSCRSASPPCSRPIGSPLICSRRLGRNKSSCRDFCQGSAAEVESACGVPTEHGPKDLRDLPEYFGHPQQPSNYGAYDIEILAEINSAPRLSRDELLTIARRYRQDGADVIDLGCDPGGAWTGVGDAVRSLRDEGPPRFDRQHECRRDRGRREVRG